MVAKLLRLLANPLATKLATLAILLGISVATRGVIQALDNDGIEDPWSVY
ncbi:hypothetical protein Pyrfu_0735 [Pyrolobus fumarii 1A]|uniref:Uncharacterized protein n=1 Tax=Pyrolobus fumarii (strain DSM 11204 / 1A) TaxID=694429 RepID=G0EDB9_PYRF1|nr:hypothetical protein Pyrfu_0735 [Pyrolobus fumarii 1A]